MSEGLLILLGIIEVIAGIVLITKNYNFSQNESDYVVLSEYTSRCWALWFIWPFVTVILCLQYLWKYLSGGIK